MPISCYQLVHFKSYRKCCSDEKIYECKAIFTAKKPEDMKDGVRAFFEKLNAKNLDFWVNGLLDASRTLPTWVFYWSSDQDSSDWCKCREGFALETVYEPQSDSDDLHTVPRDPIDKDPNAYAEALLEEFGTLNEGEDNLDGLPSLCGVDSDSDSDSDDSECCDSEESE